jgi:hypothetical protein
MKADWDKLGSKWNDSEGVMIVDVDCTGAGQSTCSQQGVKGYPTIKYFMAGSKKGKDYKQGRDFNSLDNFVKSTLDKGPACDPLTGKGCKPIQLKFIEANKDKSLEELQASLDERKAQAKETKEKKRAAEKAHKAAMKEFKTDEKKNKLATDILKTLISSKKNKDEL